MFFLRFCDCHLSSGIFEKKHYLCLIGKRGVAPVCHEMIFNIMTSYIKSIFPMIRRILFAAVVTAGTCSSCAAGSVDDIQSLPPAEFAKQAVADTSAVIIDVRTPEEFASGHIKDARLIDFKNTETFEKDIARLPKDKTYYVYCRSGRRSMMAAERMKRLGLKTIDMSGGIIAWEKDELPVVR